MTLTCKWIKDETGALVMKWTGADDEIPTMKPKMRKLTEFTVMFANNVGDTECFMRKFALCKEPAVVAGRTPAPIARAGPKGLHSRVGFA